MGVGVLVFPQGEVGDWGRGPMAGVPARRPGETRPPVAGLPHLPKLGYFGNNKYEGGKQPNHTIFKWNVLPEIKILYK